MAKERLNFKISSLLETWKAVTLIPSYLEVFEGILHFDNLKCQSFILWRMHRNLHEICLFGCSKLLNKTLFGLWLIVLIKTLIIDLSFTLFFYYKLDGSGDCLCNFHTKEWAMSVSALLQNHVCRPERKGNKAGPKD